MFGQFRGVYLLEMADRDVAGSERAVVEGDRDEGGSVGEGDDFKQRSAPGVFLVARVVEQHFFVSIFFCFVSPLAMAGLLD